MAILLSFAGSVAAFAIVWLWLERQADVEAEPPSPPLSRPKQWRLAGLILVMAVIEEGIFRWMIIGLGSRIIGIGPAFALSILAFTLAHRTNGKLSYSALINLIVVSMILGVIFWWWGFWPAVAAHFGWNLTQWWLGFNVSGEKTRALLPAPHVRHIIGYAYGPESHWIATVVMMAVLTGLLVWHPETMRL